MATGQVSNVEWVQRLANQPELAKRELRKLVELLSTDQESIREWVTEALENCGEPGDGDLAWLSQQITQGSSDTAYWCCTLLGRAGYRANTYQESIIRVLSSTKLESHAKARAIWAIGRIGSLQEAVRQSLTQFAKTTDSPRLSDLAHQALIVRS